MLKANQSPQIPFRASSFENNLAARLLATDQSRALLNKVRRRIFDFCEQEISLLTTILESSIQEADRFGDTAWLMNLTGWSKQKVQRLARQGYIPGTHQAIPGRQSSQFKFRKSEVLGWWNRVQ